MIIIPAADSHDFFAINVFQVLPENQQQLIDHLRNAGDATAIPGLLSMHLLRSKDGTQVINHMHWANKDLQTGHSPKPGHRVTRTEIRQFIEGTGPRPHEVIELKPRN